MKEGGLVRLLFLGKIDTSKGIFDVLESVKQNKKLFENKIKIIIGGDGEVEKLKQIISEYNLSGTVEYVGWVSGDKKRELFLNSDVMLSINGSIIKNNFTRFFTNINRKMLSEVLIKRVH